MRRLLGVGAVLVLISCGRESGDPAPPALEHALEVRPAAATLAPGGTQQFALTPASASVAWTVQEPSGGAVTATGLYTAPSTPGVFHVVATSLSATGVSASATVTVDSGVAIAATSPVSVSACDPVQLVATVTGSTNRGVVWTAPADCGTVTPAGLFTSLRGTGSCLVTAAAAADRTKVATVNVDVTAERVLSVAVVPATVNLTAGGVQQFAANVTTSCGTFPATL
jgi:hypothetical protein